MTLNLNDMPLEYGDEIWHQKTRIMGLPYGEKTTIVGIMGTVHELTDRWTDKQIYDD